MPEMSHMSLYMPTKCSRHHFSSFSSCISSSPFFDLIPLAFFLLIPPSCLVHQDILLWLHLLPCMLSWFVFPYISFGTALYFSIFYSIRCIVHALILVFPLRLFSLPKKIWGLNGFSQFLVL